MNKKRVAALKDEFRKSNGKVGWRQFKKRKGKA